MAKVTIVLLPEGEERVFSGIKSVHGLLGRMGLRVMEALVIRGDELLTPDRTLQDGERLTVKQVISAG